MGLNDKIRGAIVGFAFGDALGLGTEFMTKEEVKFYYPEGLKHFSQIIRDAHRSQWEPGEWSNDTEIAVRLLEQILEEDGFHIHGLARKFKAWYEETDIDMSPVYRAVCSDPEWLSHPISTAHRVWHESGLFEANNEAAQRAIVPALTSRPEDLHEHVRKISLMINDDSRCLSTSLILAHSMQVLLDEERTPSQEELIGICNNVDPRTNPWVEMAREGKLDEIDLDDEDSMGWTRKAMGAALWAMWHCNSPEEAYRRLIEEGGDADSNAAIAGAIIGIKFGYDALPEEKNKLLKIDYLLDLADRVCDYRQRHS